MPTPMPLWTLIINIYGFARFELPFVSLIFCHSTAVDVFDVHRLVSGWPVPSRCVFVCGRHFCFNFILLSAITVKFGLVVVHTDMVSHPPNTKPSHYSWSGCVLTSLCLFVYP